MGVITLTTDFGLKDYWVALLKMAILKELPNALIVDISHQISPFNKLETSYIIRNSYLHFPENSIHIIGVDSMAKKDEKHVVVEANNHFFICADNGILSLALKNIVPSKIIAIDENLYPHSSNFPTKDVFAPVACHILRGGSIDLLGKRKKTIKELSAQNPQIKEDKIIWGEVIYIDNFGNAITNIKKDLFHSMRKNRSYEIEFRNHRFKNIVNNYYDIVTNKDKEDAYHGDAVLLFNSSEQLEIAIYKSNPETVGSAYQLFGLSVGTKVMINFN